MATSSSNSGNNKKNAGILGIGFLAVAAASFGGPVVWIIEGAIVFGLLSYHTYKRSKDVELKQFFKCWQRNEELLRAQLDLELNELWTERIKELEINLRRSRGTSDEANYQRELTLIRNKIKAHVSFEDIKDLRNSKFGLAAFTSDKYQGKKISTFLRYNGFRIHNFYIKAKSFFTSILSNMMRDIQNFRSNSASFSESHNNLDLDTDAELHSNTLNKKEKKERHTRSYLGLSPSFLDQENAIYKEYSLKRGKRFDGLRDTLVKYARKHPNEDNFLHLMERIENGSKELVLDMILKKKSILLQEFFQNLKNARTKSLQEASESQKIHLEAALEIFRYDLSYIQKNKNIKLSGHFNLEGDVKNPEILLQLKDFGTRMQWKEQNIKLYDHIQAIITENPYIQYDVRYNPQIKNHLKNIRQELRILHKNIITTQHELVSKSHTFSECLKGINLRSTYDKYSDIFEAMRPPLTSSIDLEAYITASEQNLEHAIKAIRHQHGYDTSDNLSIKKMVRAFNRSQQFQLNPLYKVFHKVSKVLKSYDCYTPEELKLFLEDIIRKNDTEKYEEIIESLKTNSNISVNTLKRFEEYFEKLTQYVHYCMNLENYEESLKSLQNFAIYILPMLDSGDDDVRKTQSMFLKVQHKLGEKPYGREKPFNQNVKKYLEIGLPMQPPAPEVKPNSTPQAPSRMKYLKSVRRERNKARLPDEENSLFFIGPSVKATATSSRPSPSNF